MDELRFEQILAILPNMAPDVAVLLRMCAMTTDASLHVQLLQQAYACAANHHDPYLADLLNDLLVQAERIAAPRS